MSALLVPFAVLISIYYSNLGSLVRSLIILEFLSFYLLLSFVYVGLHILLGTYFMLFLFLTFVIEGVVGILLLIFFINYSSSAHLNILSS